MDGCDESVPDTSSIEIAADDSRADQSSRNRSLRAEGVIELYEDAVLVVVTINAMGFFGISLLMAAATFQ